MNYGFFEENGEMLGLVLGSIRHWFQGTEYHVDEFCVRTDVQGKGIGTAFMEAIQKEILKMKIQRIYLETDLRAPAFEFYKNRGFVYLQDHVALSKNLVSR